MEKYLTDLIDQMMDKSDRNMVPYDSSKTISWKALREAEKLNKEEYIAQLIAFIDNEKNKDKRDKAYFALGHIAKNTKNKNATKYLVARINTEKDKYVISYLLNRIQDLEKPLDLDIQPIIDATNSKTWQIRQSAIRSLEGSKSNLAEETLLNIINNSNDEYDLSYSNWSLSSVGTRKSLPYLLKLLEHKKQDVSGSALGAILAISNQSDLPIFIQQLEKGKNKFIALLGVIKYGDISVIPYIVNRIKQLVGKKRTIQVIGSNKETEIILALEFLANYANESIEPHKIFELLKTKKQEFLWPDEKEWLIENKNKFAN